jgi:hypothetical protein
MLPAEQAEQAWHDGLIALVTGLRAQHAIGPCRHEQAVG